MSIITLGNFNPRQIIIFLVNRFKLIHIMNIYKIHQRHKNKKGNLLLHASNIIEF